MERNKTESDMDTDRVESANEKEQEKIEEKLAEEVEWPCGGIGGENVTEDGIECVVCEKWYHVDCTDVVSPNDYINKPYTCKECPVKYRKKQKSPRIVQGERERLADQKEGRETIQSKVT